MPVTVWVHCSLSHGLLLHCFHPTLTLPSLRRELKLSMQLKQWSSNCDKNNFGLLNILFLVWNCICYAVIALWGWCWTPLYWKHTHFPCRRSLVLSYTLLRPYMLVHIHDGWISVCTNMLTGIHTFVHLITEINIHANDIGAPLVRVCTGACAQRENRLGGRLSEVQYMHKGRTTKKTPLFQSMLNSVCAEKLLWGL